MNKSSAVSVKQERHIHRLFWEQEVELLVACSVTKLKQI
jgi:hypothetical protein